jgi:hypothetical protein
MPTPRWISSLIWTLSGRINKVDILVPQSTAVLDRAKRLAGLQLADNPVIQSILVGDSFQFYQWSPSNKLKNKQRSIYGGSKKKHKQEKKRKRD